MKTEWALYFVFHGTVFKKSNASETATESIEIHKLTIFGRVLKHLLSVLLTRMKTLTLYFLELDDTQGNETLYYS